MSTNTCEIINEESGHMVRQESIKYYHYGDKLKIIKPREGRSATGFVGLENQGATCYLNSLIQAMYMTPELRAGLYQVDPTELGIQYLEQDKKATDKKPTNSAVVEADENLVAELVSMGFSEHGGRRSLIATKNNLGDAVDFFGRNCDTPGFNDPPPDDVKKKKKPRLIPLELQRLFAQMQLLDCQTVSTQELTSRGFQWQGHDGRIQHDAHELNRLLIDALEKSLKHTTGESLCRSLYQGCLAYQTKCLGCNKVYEREDVYYDLLLQVIGCPDATKALRLYTSAEELDGDNKYDCDTCHSKQRAQRSVAIRTVPPILTFSCQRFDMDRTTWQRVKVISKSVVPLLLDMSVFVEGSAHAGLPLGSEEEERKVLAEMRGTMTWIDDVCAAATAAAESLVDRYGIEANLESLSAEETAVLSRQLSSPESVLSAGEAAGKKMLLYELLAIVMHRGTAHSGHYFAYIRDSLDKGKWSMAGSDQGSGDGVGISSRRCLVSESTSPPTVFVDEDSPVGRLVVIFQSEGQSWGVGGRERMLALRKLGDAVRKHLEKSWAESHNPTFGSLVTFVGLYPELFEFSEKSNQVVLRDVHVSLLSSSEFDLSEARLSKASGNNRSTASDSTDAELRIQEDAELAKALETSLLLEDTRQDQQQADDAGESWTVAESKKKKSPRRTPPPPESGLSSRTDSTAVPRSEVADKAKSAAVEALSQHLLGRFHGHFFEFNDSAVKAVTLQSLKSSFEGQNCAYLLVYRQKRRTAASETKPPSSKFAATKAKEADAAPSVPIETTTARLLSIPVVPAPPQQWLARVSKENAELAQEKQKYDDALTLSKVRVIFPVNCVTEWPLLHPQPGKRPKQSPLPDTFVEGLEVSLSDTATVQHLLAEVARAVEAEDPRLWDSLGVPCHDQFSMAVSQLRQVSAAATEGFCICPPLPFDMSILELCGGRRNLIGGSYPSATVLLWNGRDIEGQLIRTEPEYSLVQVQVTRLDPAGGPFTDEADVPTAGVVESATAMLWLPGRLGGKWLCAALASRVGLRGDNVLLHMMEQRSCDKRHERGLYATLVKNSSLPGLDEDVLLFGTPRCTFFIEANAGLSKDGCGCLAERHVAVRNGLWSFIIDTADTCKPLHEMSMNDIFSSEDSGNVDQNAKSSTLQIEVSRHATVGELKQRAYALVHKDSAADVLVHLSYRADEDQSERFLVDDAASLVNSGLRDGTVLSMLASDLKPMGTGVGNGNKGSATGAAAKSGTPSPFQVRCCRVSYKDVAGEGKQRADEWSISVDSDSVPKGLAERGPVQELQVSESDSVASVKQRVMALLLGDLLPTPPNPAASKGKGGRGKEKPRESDLPKPEEWRLCGTNWADERTLPLTETDVTVAKVAGSSANSGNKDRCGVITIGETAVKAGTLLLLERGRAPCKGMIISPVYLWTAKHASALTLRGVTAQSLLSAETSAYRDGSEEQLLESRLETKRSCLRPIGCVDNKVTCTVQELYRQVHSLLASQQRALAIAELPDESRLLVRLLRQDLLPGKAFWLSQVAQKADVSAIGRGGGGLPKAGSGRGGKSGGESASTGAPSGLLAFKKSGSIGLVVELLDLKQSDLSKAGFGVWVQRLRNPANNIEGRSAMTPDWPPIEVLVQGGSAPSMGHLLSPISETLGIPKTSMRVFKFNPGKSDLWLEVTNGSGGAAGTVGKGRGGALAKAKSQSILSAPYNFVEGDLVCAFDSSEVPTATVVAVLRPEDAWEKRRLAALRSAGRVNKGSIKSGQSRKRGPEIPLSLGGDLDFSDEDYLSEDDVDL